MTKHIDHAAEARRLLDETSQFQTQHLEVAMTSAQAHATLALSEQQRTANLIAIMASAAQGVANMTMNRDDYMEMFHQINPQIVSALGIEGGSNEP